MGKHARLRSCLPDGRQGGWRAGSEEAYWTVADDDLDGLNLKVSPFKKTLGENQGARRLRPSRHRPSVELVEALGDRVLTAC